MNLTGQPKNGVVESILQVSWHIPVWLAIVLASLSGCLIIWLYLAERGRASRTMRWLLASIRFTLLMMVLWMLAGWSWLRFESEPPELVIVIDRSASMATRDVEDETQGTTHTRFERAMEIFSSLEHRDRMRLLNRYQVRWHFLDDKLEPLTVDLHTPEVQLPQLTPDGTQSRLGDGLLRLIERQSGRGTAAIVLISDGINTAGVSLSDAAKAARRAAIPIHAVSVGQQFELPDLRLADLLMDREVYLGDQVTVELTVFVSDIPSAETQIVLRDSLTGKVLDETRVNLSSQQRQARARLSFVPQQAGDVALKIEASPIPGETELANNMLDAVVRVQDKTIRVLLVSEIPSYEFRFLKSFLERAIQVGESASASFELDSVLQDADASYVEQDKTASRLVSSNAEVLAAYDVFVFADFDPQLVSLSSQQTIYESITRDGAGCIFIYGSGSPARRLADWPLGKLLPVEASDQRSAASPVQPGMLSWQPTPLGSTALPMQLASSIEESMSVWQRMPEFASISKAEKVKEGSQILARAVDRTSGQTAPLLITQFAGAGRTALQVTDETYRWTSFSGTDVYYQRYWGQMLRWLSRGKLNTVADNSELTVDPKQARFGQPIRLQLTLGRADAIQAASQSVEVNLEGGSVPQEPVKLSPVDQTAHIYQGVITNLKPGNYRAKLTKPLSDAPPSDDFTVTAPPGEQANLRADVRGMQQLAEHSRGQFYFAEDAARLIEELPLGKPTRLSPLPSIPLWNAWWVALLFISLLTIEWILRRKVHML